MQAPIFNTMSSNSVSEEDNCTFIDYLCLMTNQHSMNREKTTPLFPSSSFNLLLSGRSFAWNMGMETVNVISGNQIGWGSVAPCPFLNALKVRASVRHIKANIGGVVYTGVVLPSQWGDSSIAKNAFANRLNAAVDMAEDNTVKFSVTMSVLFRILLWPPSPADEVLMERSSI